MYSYCILFFACEWSGIWKHNSLKGFASRRPFITLSFFLFCANGFSSLISDAAINKMLSGISICRGCPMITHLFFADDSLLFCKASRQECQKLIEILELYEVASGQKINADKSLVFFSHNAPSGFEK